MTQRELFDPDVPPWELDAQSECRAASIVFSDPPHGPLHYRVPDTWLDQLQPGSRVKVPLGRGNREMLGYCISVETVQQPPAALKPISELVDTEPLCSPKLLELLRWISTYYLAPLGQVFETAVPAGVRSAAGTRWRTMLRASPSATEEAVAALSSAKQREIIRQLLLAEGGLTSEPLQQLVQCSAAPITALRRRPDSGYSGAGGRWNSAAVSPAPSRST